LEIVENDNEIYYFDITDEVETTYNFELTSPNWAFEGVTDEASFIYWLGNRVNSHEDANDLTNIEVSNFSLVGNTIICNMIADGTMYTLDGLQLTNADKIGVVNGLQSLMLFSNQLTSFNPAIDFPDLAVLIISQNQLSIFNPPVGLPVTMRYLDLNSNEMTTAAYTVMESWANSLLPFTSTCNVLLGGNTDSVSGTTLKTILESKNCTVSG
jgi:hypothetical protein